MLAGMIRFRSIRAINPGNRSMRGSVQIMLDWGWQSKRCITITKSSVEFYMNAIHQRLLDEVPPLKTGLPPPIMVINCDNVSLCWALYMRIYEIFHILFSYGSDEPKNVAWKQALRLSNGTFFSLPSWVWIAQRLPNHISLYNKIDKTHGLLWLQILIKPVRRSLLMVNS